MMTEEKYTSWIPFYMEFADILGKYAQDRASLCKKIEQLYSDIGMKRPTLEKGGDLIDIDPFTVFGLFNKGITNENRRKILQGIAKSFSVSAAIPECFDGVPLLNNQKATFYWFVGERGPKDIDNLWDIFIAALQYADHPSDETMGSFDAAYNTVLMQKGVKWNLTMGLFWIRPYKYINLDSRNRWFLFQPGKMPEKFLADIGDLNDMPGAEEYRHINFIAQKSLVSEKFPYRDFPGLSYYAWKISEEVNHLKKKDGGGEKNTQRGNTGGAVADQGVDTTHYWIYSPGDNACMWNEFYKEGIMAIGWSDIGDLRDYDSKDAMKLAMRQTIDPELSFKNAAHATWQFANEMKPGDIVFAKKGMHTVIGMGTVISDYEFDGNRSDDYKNLRHVKWSHEGSWNHPGQAVMKTLTDITLYEDYVKKLLTLFEEEIPDDSEEKIVENPAYTGADFLSEVFMSQEEYNTLVELLRYKKNIILQGAPGVGKTFAAKRLAYSIMGEKDPNRVAMIQFHQSYSYEDFIVGFRPDGNGFKLNYGPFYNFCKKAEIDLDNPYFFIIDEINRGNLSKIFGELFMLIEKDKRGIPLQLLYSDEKFTVPENVHIIGMMNTADRSLALLDYALRRRFAFYNMSPAFASDGFKKYLEGKNNEKLNKLIGVVQQLNAAIAEDDALGAGFCIGHSYFCTDGDASDVWLRNVVNYELIPLLEEYWYDEPDNIQKWTQKLREAIK